MDDRKPMAAKSVWWDVASCPFPDEEFSLSLAKPCIESVVNKYLGPGPVTIYAIVDARNISRSKLKDLAASGMLIIHDEFAINLRPLLKSWINHKPPPAQLLVLSDLPSLLCSEYFSKYGYELIHARTRHAPTEDEDGEIEIEWLWDWKNVLEEEIHDEDLNHGYPHLDFYEPPFLCLVCRFSAHNPEDFFDHLDSSFHREQKKFVSEPFITPEIANAARHRVAAAFHSDENKYRVRNLIAKFESDNVEKLKGKGKKFVFDHRIPVRTCRECNYTFPHYYPHFRLRCSLCMILVLVCHHCDLAKRDNYVCELCKGDNSAAEFHSERKSENKELVRNLIGKFESNNVEKLKGKGKKFVFDSDV